MNPAPALTPAGEELARLAVAAILSHERKSPDSENEPRGNESHLRPALADVLGGAGPFHPGGHQAPQRTAAAARQIAVLGKIAVNRDFGQEAGRGGEHFVYRRPGDRDVLKLTLPDAAGFGFVLAVTDSLLWLRPAIASEYLGRLGLMDAVFGVATPVADVISSSHGRPQIASTQAWVDAVIPEAEEVSDWLHAQGFLPVARAFQDRGSVPAGSAWYRPADNVLLGDAMPRNFIKTLEGIIVPIDVSLTLMPESLMPAGALVRVGSTTDGPYISQA
jgi:hypothetical protein